MITIKDIADRLGIAPSTVSKGLNDANDISPDLKQLVLDTAIEMGYVTIVAWNNRVTTRALAFYLYIDRRWCE